LISDDNEQFIENTILINIINQLNGINMKNRTTRRDFIKKSAVAAAAGAFTIVAPQTVRGTQVNSKISVGLIGAGGRGTAVCKIIQNDSRAQVIALCDRFEDRFDEAKKGIGVENPRLYGDLEKLLAAPDIDAVVIATPPFEHPRMFESAVQARKHIYYEKPAGVDVEGCARVLAASRKADPTKDIAVGLQQRYGPEYIEAYECIQNGDIGEITTVRGGTRIWNLFTKKPYNNADEEHVRNWFAYRDTSGDFLVEQNVHNLDTMQWFLGGIPKSAVSYGVRKVRKSFDILDNCTVLFAWPNDIIVTVDANQLSPMGILNIDDEFFGTKGKIVISRSALSIRKGNTPADTIQKAITRPQEQDALEHFLGRIAGNTPGNEIARGVRSTCIGILGREASYAEGREVTWDSLFWGLNV
jgi:myo-inositol 2-dehydrogenase / D-chiro-inositol 1-dehydrogenase